MTVNACNHSGVETEDCLTGPARTSGLQANLDFRGKHWLKTKLNPKLLKLCQDPSNELGVVGLLYMFLFLTHRLCFSLLFTVFSLIHG